VGITDTIADDTTMNTINDTITKAGAYTRPLFGST